MRGPRNQVCVPFFVALSVSWNENSCLHPPYRLFSLSHCFVWVISSTSGLEVKYLILLIWIVFFDMLASKDGTLGQQFPILKMHKTLFIHLIPHLLRTPPTWERELKPKTFKICLLDLIKTEPACF